MGSRVPLRAGPALVVLALALAGCASAGKVRPDRLALARLETLARAHQDDPSYEVRLNPPPCDCPPFEVRLDGRFVRVFLEPTGPDSPVVAVRAALETAAGRGETTATAAVAGRLSKGARLAPGRQPCLVLKVVALCGPEGCPKR